MCALQWWRERSFDDPLDRGSKDGEEEWIRLRHRSTLLKDFFFLLFPSYFSFYWHTHTHTRTRTLRVCVVRRLKTSVATKNRGPAALYFYNNLTGKVSTTSTTRFDAVVDFLLLLLLTDEWILLLLPLFLKDCGKEEEIIYRLIACRYSYLSPYRPLSNGNESERRRRLWAAIRRRQSVSADAAVMRIS